MALVDDSFSFLSELINVFAFVLEFVDES